MCTLATRTARIDAFFFFLFIYTRGRDDYISSEQIRHLTNNVVVFLGCRWRWHADDPKNAHLKALDGAAERLFLCKADLLDFDAICRAVEGCQGVFHTASPVTDDPVSTTSHTSLSGHRRSSSTAPIPYAPPLPPLPAKRRQQGTDHDR